MVVLIVDDERIVAESTAEVFRTAGHTAYAATSQAAALQLIEQIRPAILITDVVMPDRSGIELAIEVTHRAPECKVLLMSGQAETSDLLESAAKQGYKFDIVAKPLWPPALIQRAEAIVAHGQSSDAASATS